MSDIFPQWRGTAPLLQVLLQMARLRPIVETGYENMLLVRLVYEELQSGKRGCVRFLSRCILSNLFIF